MGGGQIAKPLGELREPVPLKAGPGELLDRLAGYLLKSMIAKLFGRGPQDFALARQ
jgi:hypothetical protein